MLPRTLFLASFLLLVGCCSLTAQTNSASLNQIARARFIMVTTEHGDQFDPKTDAADRRAVADLQNQIVAWHRFTLVHDKQDADIILAVRTSGRVRANTGIRVGSHQDPTTGKRSTTTAPVLEADAGPKDDLLSVYSAEGFPNSPALWRREQKGGFTAPSYPLFDRFKSDVEKAAVKKP